MTMSLQSLDYQTYQTDRWVRARDGMVAGVCEGLGRRFGVDPWVVRLLWLVSVFAFGTGLLLYGVMAFCLPREDRVVEAQDKRMLGVCARLSRMSGLDVGLVRVLAVLLAFASFGLTVVGYVILHFALPDDRQSLLV